MSFVNSQRHTGVVGLIEPATIGGTETSYGTLKIHTFLASGTFEYRGSGTIQVSILAVGGGGGGGSHGAGGAGGFIEESNITISPGIVNVVVGAGGTGNNDGSHNILHIGGSSTSGLAGATTAIGGGHQFSTPVGGS